MRGMISTMLCKWVSVVLEIWSPVEFLFELILPLVLRWILTPVWGHLYIYVRSPAVRLFSLHHRRTLFASPCCQFVPSFLHAGACSLSVSLQVRKLPAYYPFPDSANNRILKLRDVVDVVLLLHASEHV
jgi:hypothetical protein